MRILRVYAKLSSSFKEKIRKVTQKQLFSNQKITAQTFWNTTSEIKNNTAHHWPLTRESLDAPNRSYTFLNQTVYSAG